MPYANNNGVKIYYEVEGQGPPLVLLHGGGGDLTNWREYGYAEALRTDYGLILIDERGQGKSDKPVDPVLYDMEYRVSDVTTVLDDLHIKSAHLFGYSYGGRIGLECAKFVPQRVLSLIIGGMGPQGKSWDGSNPVLKLLETNPEALIYKPLTEEDKEHYMKTDYPAMLALVKSPWPNMEADLPAMTTPFFIYLGEFDHLWPPEVVNKAFGVLPNVTFLVLHGVDHLAFPRSDLVLPHIKEFLARVSPPQESNKEE